MLAYHVEWHLRRALAPLLFHDAGIAPARAERPSPVAKTEPLASRQGLEGRPFAPAGQPIMDFADLLAHLDTLVRNTVTTGLQTGHGFTLHTRPTTIQETASNCSRLTPRVSSRRKRPTSENAAGSMDYAIERSKGEKFGLEPPRCGAR
jgi:hypothetical protein